MTPGLSEGEIRRLVQESADRSQHRRETARPRYPRANLFLNVLIGLLLAVALIGLLFLFVRIPLL